MSRNRIYANNLSREDFAIVAVPVGKEGNEMRKFLRRQDLAGECKIQPTGHKMLHEDGLVYEEVEIISTHRTIPEEIAAATLAYQEDAAFGIPCSNCKGSGCPDCGYCGVQGC